MASAVPFLLDDTHRLVTKPGCTVHTSSAELGWKSLFISAQREKPFEASVPPVGDHLIVVHLGGPVTVSGAVDCCKVNKLVPPGGVFLWPAGSPFHIELAAAVETLHLYIRSSVVDDVATSLGYAERQRQLLPRLAELDEFLEQFAREVRRAAASGAVSSALYVDQLAVAIAAYLVRRNSMTPGCSSRPNARALSTLQFNRVTEFIETSLDKSIDLQTLSAVCGLSVSHFLRQFKLTTGRSPYQFVLGRRVERAKRLLTDSDDPVVQVAIACGFSHQEHLTHTFRRYTGNTPASFRRTARG